MWYNIKRLDLGLDGEATDEEVKWMTSLATNKDAIGVLRKKENFYLRKALGSPIEANRQRYMGRYEAYRELLVKSRQLSEAIGKRVDNMYHSTKAEAEDYYEDSIKH